ncbi:MAG: glycosyltransferase [Fibrobacter sp.]|nr:glycosyltransferase [Fibrobacter sp.]
MTPPNGTSSTTPHPYPGTIAVVIPTRNNELSIGSVIHLAQRYAAHVIVADDNSTDWTVEVARAAGAEVVSSAPGSGRTGAILAGCRHAVDAGAWAVALFDPQGYHLTDDIPALAASVLANTEDLVIGCHESLEEALSTSPAGPVVQPRHPSEPTDPRSPFRVLGPRALGLVDTVTDDDFETAMTALAVQAGLSVAERPVGIRETPTERDKFNVPLYRGKRIAVVVPAYNEELLIAETLASIPKYVAGVYVVNDQSADRTGEIIDELATRDARIHPLHHRFNQGVGGAIVSGFKGALEDGSEIVAIMAGDNQMDPAYLPSLLDPIVEGRVDITKGNRLRRGYWNGMSAWRLFGNLLLDLLNRVASGYWHVRDPQNGYVAASSDVLRLMDLDSLYKRYAFENDFMVKANILNLSMINIDIPARYANERSSIRMGNFIVMTSAFFVKSYINRLYSKYLKLVPQPVPRREDV